MKEIKKLVLVSILTQAVCYSAHTKEGFYLTGGAGFSLIEQSKQQTFYSQIISTPLTVRFQNSDRISDESFKADLGLGYDFEIDDVVLGAEGRVGYVYFDEKNAIDAKATNSGSTVNISNSDNRVKAMKINASALFKPGYKFRDTTIIRGIVGTEFMRFKTTTKADYYQLLGADPDTARVSGVRTTNKFGLSVGFGMEEQVTDNTALGLEFVHTYFGRIKGAQDLRSTIFLLGAADGTLTVNDKIKASTNSVMLRVNYYF